MITKTNSTNRQKWQQERQEIENAGLRRGPYKSELESREDFFRYLIKLAHFLLVISGLIYFGKKQAKKLAIREINHSFDSLPENFRGYRIMQITDLHLDERPEMVETVIRKIKDYPEQVDLFVFTGDIGSHGLSNKTNQKHFVSEVSKIVSAANAKDGAIAILGNHDSCKLIEHLEEAGLKVLVNETAIIERKGEKIQLIGTDDPHHFFTVDQLNILEKGKDHFTVGLVHSPELYEKAESSGVNLYLAGHTHAGQICLPGGKAVLTHLDIGKHLYKGTWKHGKMIGHTSSGVGTSNMPVRFFSIAEVVIHNLIK